MPRKFSWECYGSDSRSCKRTKKVEKENNESKTIKNRVCRFIYYCGGAKNTQNVSTPVYSICQSKRHVFHMH